MGGNPNKIKGKGFDKFPEHINRKGRPKRTFAVVNDELKKKGYIPVTPSQLKEAYELILGLPYSEILLIANQKYILNQDELRSAKGAGCRQPPLVITSAADDYPYHFRVIARAILNNKDGFNYIKQLIDRAQGTPKQSIEHSGEMNEVININLKYD